MAKNKLPITQQNDRADCGVACLQSLLHHYGGDATLEELRAKSGTNTQGTTLLGLYHAAQALGFEAQGCEANAQALIDHAQPVILHVVLPEGFRHYVICYRALPNQFTIADPATGSIETWDETKLDDLWKSRTCLTLAPKNIVQTQTVNRAKKQFLKDLLLPDVPLLAIAAGLGLIISLLGLVMAIFSQQLIDTILPNGQTQKFVFGLGLVFVLLLLRTVFQRLRQILLVRQTQAFNNRVIEAFYTALLRLPITFFDTRKIGDLTARLNDTARIQRVIAQVAGNAIIEVLMVLTSLGFLFVYSWQVGLVALASAPLMFVLLYRYNKPIYSAQQAAMAGYAQSESYFVNSMQGALAIKQFGREATFAETNKTIYSQYQARLFDLGLLNVRMGFQAGLLSLVFVVGVVALAGALVLNQSLLLGEMMAAVGVATSLLPGITNLALLSVPINEARVAYNRMFEVLKIEPEVMGGADINAVEVITLHNIGFGYAGRSALFKGLNQTFTKGDVVLISGANGSGKSTFTKLLQKLYAPTEGQIIINKKTILAEMSTAAWRKLIGAVGQEVQIFNGTVAENLLLAWPNQDVQALQRFLTEQGFDDFFIKLPQGYATLVGEQGVNLSGGQQQLIGLARALMRQPQVLILDEPETALDGEVRVFLLEKIASAKRHAIVYICSHQPERFEAIASKRLIF